MSRDRLTGPLRRASFEYGCVIRSLETGLKVKAVPDQWASRLRFMNFQRSLERGEADPETQANFANILQYPHILDWRLIQVMIQGFAESDTPLGGALRKHDHQFGARTTIELLQESLHKERVVCAGYWLPNEAHMAYLKPSGGRLLMASDLNRPFPTFPRDQKLPSVVFVPK